MIKLTLTPFTQPITYIFEKQNILIGRMPSTGALPDLALSHSEAQEVHVEIDFIGNNFIAFNSAKDPYTTINDLPFGKRKLCNGDLLQIGPTLFQFEGIPPDANTSPLSETIIASLENPRLIQSLADKMEAAYEEPPAATSAVAPHPDSFDLDAAMRQLEQELQHPPTGKHSHTHEEELTEDELDALLLEVAQLDRELPVEETLHPEPPRDLPLPEKAEAEVSFSSPELPAKELKLPHDEEPKKDLDRAEHPTTEMDDEIVPSPLEGRRSIKDDLTPDDDASTKEGPAPSKTASMSLFNWGSLFAAFGAFLLLLLIVAGCLYYATADRNEEEEIKAAQAVSDVAMALNFAQINHNQPQNHNWSDSDFLAHNLGAVLASSYSPLATIDAQGQLKNTPYILRIYTGNDLNHFLIIAQPSPNLLQWMLPKAAITVDSSFMELRKISDLKTLNRLLINATLDTSNSTKIAHLVNLGELIPLKELIKFHPHSGFNLPKALAYMHPGAENLIYNSTRYYPLGETLMKKAIALYDADDNSQDLAHLIAEINRFSQFPHIVLYSSQGIAMAEKGRKALATFAPDSKFLLAYLQFNAQNFIVGSHLLMDSDDEQLVTLNDPLEGTELSRDEQEESFESSESGSTSSPEGSADELLDFFETLYREHYTELQAPSSRGATEISTPSKSSFFRQEEVDQNHPLYYKLGALYKSREEGLKQIQTKIDKEKSQRRWDSSKKLIALKVEYEIASDEWLEKMIESVEELQQEYGTMPFAEFMEYVKAANIEPFIAQNLQNKLNDPVYIPFSRELIRSQIGKIKEVTSLKSLDEVLRNTAHLVSLKNFPDPTLLIAYQNEIHSTVVHKLDHFLFSPSTPLSEKDLNQKNRALVSHILKTAWVADEGESEYYLNEFDLLQQQKTE